MNAVSNQSTLSVLIPNINKERIFMMCIRLTWSRDIFGGNQLAWSFWKCSRSLSMELGCYSFSTVPQTSVTFA